MHAATLALTLLIQIVRAMAFMSDRRQRDKFDIQPCFSRRHVDLSQAQAEPIAVEGMKCLAYNFSEFSSRHTAERSDDFVAIGFHAVQR